MPLFFQKLAICKAVLYEQSIFYTEVSTAILSLMFAFFTNLKTYNTGVAISTGTEFQMVVAQKWLNPGP